MLMLSPPPGTAKENQAPCLRALWPRGLHDLRFYFVVTEQAVLVWPKARMVTLEPNSFRGWRWPRGPLRDSAPPPPQFPKGGPEPQTLGFLAGAPCSVGPGEAPGETRSRPGTRAALHLGVDLPHLIARPPCRDCWPRSPRPGPLCDAHERAEAEKGSPSNTESPKKSTFLSQPAGLAQACCFQVASHSLSP